MGCHEKSTASTVRNCSTWVLTTDTLRFLHELIYILDSKLIIIFDLDIHRDDFLIVRGLNSIPVNCRDDQ